ncbi:MAG TPA: ChaN family lipoprotein [Terriglobales bacterium]|nr:ChaN family lipoprotein [Terriglobales bacterium]
MASPNLLRFRRSLAQWHALESVERQIRSTDPHLRRKYLREFTEAYQTYDSVLTTAEVGADCHTADVLLIADYHALPASQHFATELIEQLSASGRQVVLGLEFVFARDQHTIDEWVAGEIDSNELRERIRFDLDWGYQWEPFYRVLESGRRQAERVYGLDCLPRNNLRKISARDRHAAALIDDIRKRHPEAVVVVLFGESHLAPTHLPALLRQRRPDDRILTILQNVDPLYWKAAGEPFERVEAVRVSDEVVCVFNSTPLEKYESYRLCIERWKQERTTRPDLAPSFFNMISALLRFLNIDAYSPTTGTQPGFLVDQLPEVYSQVSPQRIRRLLLNRGAEDDEVRAILSRFHANGTCYVPSLNSVFVREYTLVNGAEEAARFLHLVARGSMAESENHPAQDRAAEATEDPPSDGLDRASTSDEDRFYTRVLEEALAYFGSRALYPGRAPVKEIDLYGLYSEPREPIDTVGLRSQREYLQMIDFLVLHRDYETNCRNYRERPQLLHEGVGWPGARFDFVTQWLGRLLGSQIYDAYVSGRVAKRFIRALFLRNLDKPGTARTLYFVTIRRLRQPRRRTLI